jgi:hypothetical protein
MPDQFFESSLLQLPAGMFWSTGKLQAAMFKRSATFPVFADGAFGLISLGGLTSQV